MYIKDSRDISLIEFTVGGENLKNSLNLMLRILYTLGFYYIRQKSHNCFRLMKLSGVICANWLHILWKNHDPRAKINDSLLSNRKFFLFFFFFFEKFEKNIISCSREISSLISFCTSIRSIHRYFHHNWSINTVCATFFIRIYTGENRRFLVYMSIKYSFKNRRLITAQFPPVVL